jgi:serine/threonine protein kinase
VCARCGLDLSNGIRRRSLVAGRYEVLGHLGNGSVASVYRALDRRQDVVVALKVFRPDLRRTAATDAAFRRELASVSDLRHRNLCAVLGGGEHTGLLYLVLEALPGVSLKQHLRKPGGVSGEEAFDLGTQIVAGLEALHGGGALHRDLKPQNVTVDADGLARIMDLDLTKRGSASGAITITSVGKLFGAAEYLSPELTRGAPPDARSDVYSAGCVLYELFTGHPPYRAPTPVATALKHVHEPLPLEGPRAARIPEPMIPLFRKVLAKNPARRYPTARALGSALALVRTMSAPRHLPAAEASKGPLPALLSALNPLDATIRLNLEDIKAADPGSRRAIPVLLHALEGRRDEAGSDDRLLADLLAEVEGGEPKEPSWPLSSPGAYGAAPAAVSFKGSPGSIGILIGALQEKDGTVRAKAARALGSIGPGAREAIPVLLGALQDQEAHVRWDAARALGRIGAAAAEGLAAAVDDKDPVVRQIAADALKRIIRRKRETQAGE